MEEINISKAAFISFIRDEHIAAITDRGYVAIWKESVQYDTGQDIDIVLTESEVKELANDTPIERDGFRLCYNEQVYPDPDMPDSE